MGQQELLEAREAELFEQIEKIINAAEAESRAITDEEHVEINGHHAEIQTIAEKRKSMQAVKQHLDARGRTLDTVSPVPPVPPVSPIRTEERSEPYRRGGKDSYFVDLLRSKQGDADARDRLVRNERHANANRETRAGETTVAGAGGEFAPPLWQEDAFIKYLRAGRVFADQLNKKDLPAGVSSINLPKVTGGTAVATQGTQNTAINQQDITTSSVSTTISTIAGGALISMQLIEQSPVSIDDVILQDLAADLARAIDRAAITAVAGVSGLNAITYTATTPTSVAVTQYVQQGIDGVSNAVFMAPDKIVMRPERWGKLIAAGDSAGRPLVLPAAAYGPYNALGSANGQTAQGYAGNLRGVDVYLDANIPNNLSTNQDEIFILRSDQIFLYESAPKFETFEQTYANQLSLYVRGYEYYGLIANRYPGAISLLTGTGMATTLAYGA